MAAQGTPAPHQSTRQAGLHYATDTSTGIRRVRCGKGFIYRNAAGRLVRAAVTLTRIRSLVLPPAWRDVRVAIDPLAHLQATGLDAAGRKQYRYHPSWAAVRDSTKYHRMLAFARALPAIRRRTARDWRGPARPRMLSKARAPRGFTPDRGAPAGVASEGEPRQQSPVAEHTARAFSPDYLACERLLRWAADRWRPASTVLLCPTASQLSLRAGARAGCFWFRYFRALLPGFAQTDGDRLFPILDGLARATFERALLPPTHG